MWTKGRFDVDLLAAAKVPVWEACEKSGIEWSRFNVGSFMNYLGIGCGQNEDEACAGVDRGLWSWRTGRGIWILWGIR